MHIDLSCPVCSSDFTAPLHLPAADVRERMAEEGRRYRLAEGETFEEMILATLVRQGYVGCPDCGGAVAISEGGRGRPRPRARASMP
ncbi:MAG TPA: hypothetical protein VJ739_12045 [Gemmataceae bacterium]|nr:hypothetical protein [Gemmataceae bacterium]